MTRTMRNKLISFAAWTQNGSRIVKITDEHRRQGFDLPFVGDHASLEEWLLKIAYDEVLHREGTKLVENVKRYDELTEQDGNLWRRR